VPRYAILYNYTESGRRDIKESPRRIRELMGQYESLGITVHGLYLSVGTYDLVEIVDIPNEQIGLVGLLSKAMTGNVQTTTMRLFDLEDLSRPLVVCPESVERTWVPPVWDPRSVNCALLGCIGGPSTGQRGLPLRGRSDTRLHVPAIAIRGWRHSAADDAHSPWQAKGMAPRTIVARDAECQVA